MNMKFPMYLSLLVKYNKSLPSCHKITRYINSVKAIYTDNSYRIYSFYSPFIHKPTPHFWKRKVLKVYNPIASRPPKNNRTALKKWYIFFLNYKLNRSLWLFTLYCLSLSFCSLLSKSYRYLKKNYLVNSDESAYIKIRGWKQNL